MSAQAYARISSPHPENKPTNQPYMRLNKSIMGTLAIAAACLTTVTSCSGDGQDLPYEYLAVQENEDGNWSFYSPDGEVLLKDEFKNRPSDVVNGYFFVPEGKKDALTLYKFGSKPEAVAEGFKELGYMGEEGLIPSVRENERIALLDGKGKVKFTLQPVGGREVTECADSYSEGLLTFAVIDDKGLTKCGYFDTNGKVAIAPKYSSAEAFREGLAIVCVSDTSYGDKAEYAIIDKKGEVVKKFNAGTIACSAGFSSGRMVFCDANGRHIIVDKKGETITKLPAKVKSVGGYDDEYVVFKDEDDNFGVMNYEGEVLVRPRYSVIEIIGHNRFLGNIKGSDDDDTGVIFNSDGDEEMRIEGFKGVDWFGQYGLIGVDKKTSTFLDKDGKARKNAEFYRITGEHPVTVHSDYFNAEAVISAFTSLVNDKGAGRYAPGMTPAQIFQGIDPEEYVYKEVAPLDDLKKEGYRYSIVAEGFFSSNIAISEYDENFQSRYIWNPNSSLYFIALEITSDKWDAKNSEALADAFIKKGFKKEACTSVEGPRYCAMLTKGDLMLLVAHDGVGILRNEESLRNVGLQTIDQCDQYNRTYSSDDEAAVEVGEVAVADSVEVVEATDY